MTAGGGTNVPTTSERHLLRTPFSYILDRLVCRVPGARYAVLVDGEGEAVDHSGDAEPFSIQLAGAHWQIVLAHLAGVRQIVALATKRSYLVRALPNDHVLVVVLDVDAGFDGTHRAVDVCVRELADEAAWRQPASARWSYASPDIDAAGRPTSLAMAGVAQSAIVLGTVRGLRAGERGYRVRLSAGAEINLICEPGDHWYAEDAD